MCEKNGALLGVVAVYCNRDLLFAVKTLIRASINSTIVVTQETASKACAEILATNALIAIVENSNLVRHGVDVAVRLKRCGVRVVVLTTCKDTRLAAAPIYQLESRKPDTLLRALKIDYAADKSKSAAARCRRVSEQKLVEAVEQDKAAEAWKRLTESRATEVAAR